VQKRRYFKRIPGETILYQTVTKEEEECKEKEKKIGFGYVGNLEILRR